MRHEQVTPLIIPTIHKNGTHKAILLDQLSAVEEAFLDLLDALRDAAPNARDYPDAAAAQSAYHAHLWRVRTICTMADEFSELAFEIDQQP